MSKSKFNPDLQLDFGLMCVNLNYLKQNLIATSYTQSKKINHNSKK